MIRTDRFRIAGLYAIDPASQAVTTCAHDGNGQTRSWHCQIRAAWFRRRHRVTIACTGTLGAYLEAAPADVWDALARHTGGRSGGTCTSRWDGTGYWGDQVLTSIEANLALLLPMLAAYTRPYRPDSTAGGTFHARHRHTAPDRTRSPESGISKNEPRPFAGAPSLTWSTLAMTEPASTEPTWVCQDPAGEWGVARVDTVAGYRRRPCATCPWRTDAPLGAFPDSVFDSSRHTSVQPEVWDGQPQHQFGCHETAPSTGAKAALTCAGFLAVAGAENLSVRVAVLEGAIAPEALEPGRDWPALYASYDAMAEANRVANAHENDGDQ